MTGRHFRAVNWRGVGLIGIGMVAGMTFMTPAVADVTASHTLEEIKDMWRHLKGRVTKLGDLRWLGILAKAADSDKLDGVDSTGFLGANATAANADLLDGFNSTAFLGVSAKAADANLLDGIDSSSFLRTTGKAADSDLLDGLNSTAFLGVSATAANSQLLDNLDSSDFQKSDVIANPGFESGHTLVGVDFDVSCTRGEVRVIPVAGGVDALCACLDVNATLLDPDWVCFR